MTPEILAPAGSMEALKAAVRTGADAVYLGAGNFNARRNATNFTMDELGEAIEYCHVRGVKVHLALNTLVSDREIEDTLEIIKSACTLGVDAFIVQDLGLASIVHAVAPDMPLHASTQVSVMTPGGFKELEKLGFTRAVLPRELSLKEIIEIRKETDIELEAFVHGALCMCVSGQCYLSSMIGGRSGNRGLCAQPCRLKFSAPGGTGHDLSLKDLSIVENIPELIKIGVCSFKIEGRMKRPEYVAAAVTACRNSLKGIADEELNSSLYAVFSRSGFTDGYYKGARGKDMFGTRQKDDVVAASTVLAKLQKLYEKESSPNDLSIEFRALKGKPLSINAKGTIAKTGDVYCAEVFSEQITEEAQKKATTEDSVRTQLMKTGGTAWTVSEDNLSISLGDNLFIPVSEINALRRAAIASIEEQIIFSAKKSFFSDRLPTVEAFSHNSKDLYIRLQSVSQLPKASVGKIIIPLFSSDEDYRLIRESGKEFGVEIPRGIYGNRSIARIRQALTKAKDAGATFAFVGTLDGMVLANEAKLQTIGNFTLNCYNSYTTAVYEDLGVLTLCISPELRLSDISGIKTDVETGLFAYGRMPLMLTRNCPVSNGTSCSRCGSGRSLRDRKNVDFPVRCNLGVAEVLNSVPTYMGDREHEIRNLDFRLLYFTDENADEVEQIINLYNNGGTFEGDFTRGLYYRGAQ